MNTKRPIIDFLADRLPDFQFVGERRPNLVFHWPQSSGIIRMLAIQRDSPSHGLAVELAATYNPKWCGEPAYPLGVCAGLANLRLNSNMIEAMKHWMFYEPTREGLDRTLQEMLHQYMKFAPKFFDQAEGELHSRRLLQLALAKAKTFTRDERDGLHEALEKAKFRLVDLKHPAYLRLRAILREAWAPDVPRNESKVSDRLAYDALLLT